MTGISTVYRRVTGLARMAMDTLTGLTCFGIVAVMIGGFVAGYSALVIKQRLYGVLFMNIYIARAFWLPVAVPFSCIVIIVAWLCDALSAAESLWMFTACVGGSVISFVLIEFSHRVLIATTLGIAARRGETIGNPRVRGMLLKSMKAWPGLYGKVARQLGVTQTQMHASLGGIKGSP